MERKSWKKWIVLAAVAAVVILGVLVGITLRQKAEWEREHIFINGAEYPRSVAQLDLRGAQEPELGQIAQLEALRELDLRDTGISIEAYEALRAALPDCEIRWSVPFQGGYVDCASQSVEISSLTEADIAVLDYLPGLTRVDAAQCRDYAQLLALRQHRPECEVVYDLVIQEQAYPLDTTQLTLEGISAGELELMNAHMPLLETITLTGLQADPGALLDLMDSYPQYTFCWDTEICGVTVNSQATFLDFSGIPIEDPAALEAIVTRLPKLEQVDMCDCGISYEEMDALNRRHENIKFVWMIDYGWARYRTDITYMIPCMQNLWFNDDLAKTLNYFTDMECLDLGHHKITNCEFVRNMPKLKYLLLGDTYVSDLTPIEGLTDLIYLEIFLTHVTDYTPILQLKKLESLNLCYTEGDPEVIAQLTWVDYIRWVNFERYCLTPAEQKLLRESLPDTLVELEIGTSSTGGQWRQHRNYFDMRDILGMYYMTG